MTANKVVSEALKNLTWDLYCKWSHPLWPEGPTGEQYMDGIVRYKGEGDTRGSYVVGLDSYGKTVEFLLGLYWERVQVDSTIQFGTCMYFQAQVPPGYKAIQDIMLVRDVHPKQGLEIRKGLHGDELVLKRTDTIESFLTNKISCIIEDSMLSTWFPGDFTARSPEKIECERSEYNPYWAVKLL